MQWSRLSRWSREIPMELDLLTHLWCRLLPAAPRHLELVRCNSFMELPSWGSLRRCLDQLLAFSQSCTWNHQEQGPPSSAQRRGLSVSSPWFPCIWAAFGKLFLCFVLQTHSLLVSSESVLGYRKLLSCLGKWPLGGGAGSWPHLPWGEALLVSSLINQQVSIHASCLTRSHLFILCLLSPYCSASQTRASMHQQGLLTHTMPGSIPSFWPVDLSWGLCTICLGTTHLVQLSVSIYYFQ